MLWNGTLVRQSIFISVDFFYFKMICKTWSKYRGIKKLRSLLRHPVQCNSKRLVLVYLRRARDSRPNLRCLFDKHAGLELSVDRCHKTVAGNQHLSGKIGNYLCGVDSSGVFYDRP